MKAAPSRAAVAMSALARDTHGTMLAELGVERVFLGWIAISLAHIVTALAVVAVPLPIDAGWRLAAAGVLLLVAIAASVQAHLGARATDRALRVGDDPPALRSGGAIAAGAGVAAFLLLLGWIMT